MFRSLSARIFAILAIGLVVVQVGSFGAFLAFRGNESRLQMERFMGADVAFVFEFMRSLPSQERKAWLPRLDRGYYTFSLLDRESALGATVGFEEDRRVAGLMRLLEQHLPGDVKPVFLHPQAAEVTANASKLQRLLLPLYCMTWSMCRDLDETYVQILLPLDAQQTMVLHLVDPFARPSGGTLALYLLAVLVAVTPFVWWAVRLTMRRVTIMLDALERFGRNIASPPLPETGPIELKRAAAVFNGMRERILRQLDERTQILAAISHDLQTPLTRLRLRAEAIGCDSHRERMVADVDLMAGLVREGLDYARSAHPSEPHSAIEVNHWLEGMVDDATDAGGDCTLSGTAQQPYRGALRALTRATQNLVDNALKFGGSARIEIEDSAERLVIRVLDEGPGIAQDLLEKVFDPFFRAETSRNRETGGSGLGLTIARNLIRAHGGDIRLTNRTEGGLCAAIELPRRTSRSERVN